MNEWKTLFNEDGSVSLETELRVYGIIKIVFSKSRSVPALFSICMNTCKTMLGSHATCMSKQVYKVNSSSRKLYIAACIRYLTLHALWQ